MRIVFASSVTPQDADERANLMASAPGLLAEVISLRTRCGARRDGVPLAAYRALDYAGASLGTILRNGPPKTGEAFATLADEFELIRQACQIGKGYGEADPTPADSFSSQALRDIFLG